MVLGWIILAFLLADAVGTPDPALRKRRIWLIAGIVMFALVLRLFHVHL